MLYELALVVHVVAVIAAFGVLFIWPALPTGTAAAHQQRARLLGTISWIALVALLAGLLMAADRALFARAWVAVPLAIMLVVLGVMGAVMTPGERRVARAVETDELGAHRLAARVNGTAMACAALVTVAAALMVIKP